MEVRGETEIGKIGKEIKLKVFLKKAHNSFREVTVKGTNHPLPFSIP